MKKHHYILTLLTWMAFANISNAEIKEYKFAKIDSLLINNGSGFYRWRDIEAFPINTLDHYQRYSWSALEKEEGVYDFSIIKRDAEKARLNLAGHSTLGFGVRCLVEGVEHSYPPYLDKNMSSWYSQNKKCWVPDWNNGYFLARIDSLFQALSKEFKNDVRISFIEIRTFGNWGEFHLWEFEKPIEPLTAITPETLHKMIDIHANAFPNKQIIIMSDNNEALEYAMSKKDLEYPIGWRRDSWANPHFNDIREQKTWNLAKERWKTAPVIVESYGFGTGVQPKIGPEQVLEYHISDIGNGNFAKTNRELDQYSKENKDLLIKSASIAGYRYAPFSISFPSSIRKNGLMKIKSFWSNFGVAPVYRKWNVCYRLVDAKSNKIAWEGISKLNLKSLLPTIHDGKDKQVEILDEFPIPTNFNFGTYRLELVVIDPVGYLSPMKLGVSGRNKNGAYEFGSIKISK